MRVIAGSARGRPLLAPRGQSTRPTPDRVREALFSIIGSRVAGARVLDLFAGTGALGIEALSRGASTAVFVEQHRRVADILRRNLQAVPEADAEILNMKSSRALSVLAKRGSGFDLIFLDPPYAAELLEPTLQQLSRLNMAYPRGLVICEHPSRISAPRSSDWVVEGTRRFGDVSVSLCRSAKGGKS